MTPRRRRIKLSLAALAGAGLLTLTCCYSWGYGFWYPFKEKAQGRRTVAEVIETFGPEARARLHPHLEAAGVAWPPEEVTLLAMKEEATLEVWVRPKGQRRHVLLRAYDIMAASGDAGPKLREGDRQVPEGLYQIVGLNPNSSYHLSMKLNYPNDFDLKHAKREGRTQPGSDIFIHGKAVSIGCLAMGDPAIEELFVLIEAAGARGTPVIIAPHDPARRPLEADPEMPTWTQGLYDRIAERFLAVRGG